MYTRVWKLIRGVRSFREVLRVADNDYIAVDRPWNSVGERNESHVIGWHYPTLDAAKRACQDYMTEVSR